MIALHLIQDSIYAPCVLSMTANVSVPPYMWFSACKDGHGMQW